MVRNTLPLQRVTGGSAAQPWPVRAACCRPVTNG